MDNLTCVSWSIGVAININIGSSKVIERVCSIMQKIYTINFSILDVSNFLWHLSVLNSNFEYKLDNLRIISKVHNQIKSTRAQIYFLSITTRWTLFYIYNLYLFLIILLINSLGLVYY